jgi:uroporphyrin-III C-methyltransferase
LAASALVSLTLRGVARQVRFLTAQSCDDDTSATIWAALADPATTLAVYMGRRAATRVAHNLMAHGLPAATPVLVGSNVSLPDEQVIRTRLDLLPVAVDRDFAAGPALIVIGQAVDSTKPAAETCMSPRTWERKRETRSPKSALRAN